MAKILSLALPQNQSVVSLGFSSRIKSDTTKAENSVRHHAHDVVEISNSAVAKIELEQNLTFKLKLAKKEAITLNDLEHTFTEETGVGFNPQKIFTINESLIRDIYRDIEDRGKVSVIKSNLFKASPGEISIAKQQAKSIKNRTSVFSDLHLQASSIQNKAERQGKEKVF